MPPLHCSLRTPHRTSPRRSHSPSRPHRPAGRSKLVTVASRLGLDRLVQEEGREEGVVHSRWGAGAGLGTHGVAAADDERRAVVRVRLVEEQPQAAGVQRVGQCWLRHSAWRQAALGGAEGRGGVERQCEEEVTPLSQQPVAAPQHLVQAGTATGGGRGGEGVGVEGVVHDDVVA